ncbi:MAG: LysR family transcriptional regulator [Cyanophyceae cyanobacterium]
MSANPFSLKISQLRTLVEVAEQGNFSEAALQLGVSQSAVSHAIATLEEELGVLLFNRGRQGASPTPIGERMIVQARQVLALLVDMVQEANREKGLEGGQVRIATFRSVATRILPSVISRFRSNFPLITVSVTEADELFEIEQLLRAGHADIGFTHLPCSADFESFEILRDEYIVLLPPAFQSSQEQLSWEELAAYPLIISSEDSCSISIRNYLKSAKVPVDIAYRIRQDSTIVSMAMQGLGAAILPRLAAEPIPADLKVRHLPTSLERLIGVVMFKNALHTPAVFAFLEAVRNAGQFGVARAAKTEKNQ